ncbi:MAG: ribonuclease III [Candidatus Dormibacteria bacterium]
MGLHSGEGRSRKLTPSPYEQFLTAHERDQFDALQKRIGIRFNSTALLHEAMTHASWSNEQHRGGRDNERLEYLGDAVLELVVAEYLFKRFPTYDEGKLTRIRAALVNTGSLARCAEKLQLGDALLVGKGADKIGARQTPSLLANVFEAMVGAVFLDHGYNEAVRIFLEVGGDVESIEDENYKGHLQERVQELHGVAPTYRVTAHRTKNNVHEYHAEVLRGSEILGVGTGGSKQAAEQSAAQNALEHMLGTARRTHHDDQVVGRTHPAQKNVKPDSVLHRSPHRTKASDHSISTTPVEQDTQHRGVKSLVERLFRRGAPASRSKVESQAKDDSAASREENARQVHSRPRQGHRPEPKMKK